MLALGCWAMLVLLILVRWLVLGVLQEGSRVVAHLGGVAVGFCLRVCVFLGVLEECQGKDVHCFV